ncbi:MAG: AmmeMemoRadiSam system protein B [Spirochaetota bacterium]|mgnify:CR=1 FL=1
MADDFTRERAPAAAGTFYDGDASALRSDIERYCAEPDVAPCTDAFGIIVPHAGHIYSGPVAGYAYKAVSRLSFDTALLIGRSHRSLFPGAAVDISSANRTPLGAVPTDRDIAAYLLSQPLMLRKQDVFTHEHALEVNLPFLQMTHPSASIVSILLGTDTGAVTDAVGNAIAAVRKGFTGKRTLIVCSTDLSHFHDYRAAKAIDERFEHALALFNVDALEAELHDGTVEACGGAAVVATLKAARSAGASEVRILDIRSSGDTAGDKGRVVGYLSAVIH